MSRPTRVMSIGMGLALLTGLVGPAFPAQAQPLGDRSQRCGDAYVVARDLRTLMRGYQQNWRNGADGITFALINRRSADERRKLSAVLAAPRNRDLLAQITAISNDFGARRNMTEANLERLLRKADELVSNVSERREFTVTYRDAEGQEQTKTTAC